MAQIEPLMKMQIFIRSQPIKSVKVIDKSIIEICLFSPVTKKARAAYYMGASPKSIIPITDHSGQLLEAFLLGTDSREPNRKHGKLYRFSTLRYL